MLLQATLAATLASHAFAGRVFYVGGQSNAKRDLASGIEDVLMASGAFPDLEIAWSSLDGSSVTRWYNNGVPGPSYDGGMYDTDGSGMGLVQKAMASDPSNTFEGFFWWQGEGDASASQLYADRFKGLINRLGQDLGRAAGPAPDGWSYHLALPYVWGVDENNVDHTGQYTAIREVQKAMATADSAFATYFDTASYARGAGNPHTSVDGCYYIGAAMANQFLAQRGLAQVSLDATEDMVLIKRNTADSVSTTVDNTWTNVQLNRAQSWTTLKVPGPKTILQFDETLTSAQYFYFGTGPDGNALSIRGIRYKSPYAITLSNGDVVIGAEGIDGSEAASDLRLRPNKLTTSAPQVWTFKQGRKVWMDNQNTYADLRQVTLVGEGSFELRAGTYDLGSSLNTAPIILYNGGPKLIFAAASNGNLASPLGTAATLVVGHGTWFSYNGTSPASWDRNVRLNGSGTQGTFEIANDGVVFDSSGMFGHQGSANSFKWRIGGEGDIKLTGVGGVAATGTATMSLEKFGGGRLTLEGTGNKINGQISVTGGTLAISGAGVNATPTNVAVSSGTLEMSAGTLAPTQTSNSILLGSGAAAASAGVLRQSGGSVGSGQVTLTPGGVYEIQGGSVAAANGLRFASADSTTQTGGTIRVVGSGASAITFGGLQYASSADADKATFSFVLDSSPQHIRPIVLSSAGTDGSNLRTRARLAVELKGGVLLSDTRTYTLIDRPGDEVDTQWAFGPSALWNASSTDMGGRNLIQVALAGAPKASLDQNGQRVAEFTPSSFGYVDLIGVDGSQPLYLDIRGGSISSITNAFDDAGVVWTTTDLPTGYEIEIVGVADGFATATTFAWDMRTIGAGIEIQGVSLGVVPEPGSLVVLSSTAVLGLLCGRRR